MNHDPWNNSDWIKVPRDIPERLSSFLPGESEVVVTTCGEFVKPNLNFFKDNHDVDEANRRVLYRIVHEHHVHDYINDTRFIEFVVAFHRHDDHFGAPAEQGDKEESVVNPSGDETEDSEDETIFH